METIDDEVVIKKTLKKKITTFDTPTTNLHSKKMKRLTNKTKIRKKYPNIYVITLISSVLPEANTIMTQRTIEVATAAVIVNNKIATSITIQIRLSRGSTNLNVLKAHQHIFSAIKLIDLTLKIIAF